MLIATGLALTNALPTTLLPRDGVSITSDLLNSINTKGSSCTGADYPDECATYATAAPAITASFSKYGVTTTGQQAALLSIMLFESDYFHYNKHHFPSPNPGQGTRNMQSLTYNQQYATALYGASAVQQASTSGGDSVLQLVLGDDASFGSAAWFFSTQCTDAVKQGLVFGDKNGWAQYLTQCVGTTDTEDRDVVWQKVNEVLKGAGSSTTTTTTTQQTDGNSCP
ncbi:hypothetical protein K491DRAFT_584182 [Lophiostoma macrostomum CBS 122681]|uniref:Uncharacterized protein n=1 Tax=Lophiostoma macrostomum CBS 122681 TaxID=1314788 RepID=A0A6A6TRS1_9PLEO|nr:hypothetical protein K491DRAFT_584182 [Lophiostoma macrostomum CBS 122681]